MLCSRKEFPFRKKMEKNSALRRTLVKSYEFVLSYCTKAVLNRPADAFYRLAICASILEILFFLEHQFQLISICFEQFISKIFVMKQPWSNISEKSFSILKTVKTLTHSKMTAGNRLNHLLVHIYKKEFDEMNIKWTTNQFIKVKKSRSATFVVSLEHLFLLAYFLLLLNPFFFFIFHFDSPWNLQKISKVTSARIFFFFLSYDSY